MTRTITATLVIIMLALLGCGTSPKDEVNICDNTLQNCVRILGQESKDKCYTTYHACIIKRN